MAGLFDNVYNPDVLSCLANLSSDEVFTPPEVANKMLDMLPQELFSNPDTKFLDPACKSGVFLREIVKRLLVGLENQIPDIQQRINHIMHDMVYGIAITELTSLIARRSLYCSKNASGEFSVTRFDNVDGNIRYKLVRHTWENGKCIYCGASQASNDRPDELESHAYEFIHWLKPEEIFGMKFDVVVSNPPYQLSTSSSTAQATPLYDKFVLKAKSLNPRYITMIIPSRWFAGGMGLDSFRENMLSDGKIRNLVDYANAKDCFAGLSIGGGVCYFLWDRDNPGLCKIINASNSGYSVPMERNLNEFSVFVRYNSAVSIIRKVLSKKEKLMTEIVSSLSPFGLGSSFRGHNEKSTGDVSVYSSKGVVYLSLSSVPQGLDYINKYQVAMSKVTGEHAGEPAKDGKFRVISKMWVLKPSEVCTFSYFLIGNTDSEIEAINIRKYLATKFARFLLLQSISSINISRDKFRFIPVQDFSKVWTDDLLYKKYNLSENEISFIESIIKEMD